MSASLGEAVFSLQVETSEYDSQFDHAQSTAETHSGAIQHAVDGIGESFKRASEMALGFAEAQVALSGVHAIFDAFKESMIGWNAALEQSGIAWGTFLNNASEASTMLYALQQFTNKTQYQMPQINQLAQQLQNAGLQGNNLIAILGDVVTASDATGRGAVGLQEVGYAIAEINRQGTVMQRQMRMLANDGIQTNLIYQQMADDMGVSFATIQDMLHKGTLTADEFMAAFDTVMRTRYGDLVYQQSQTFTGAMSTIKDQVRLLGSEAFQPLFTLISQVAVHVADELSTSGSDFQKFGEKVNVIMAAIANAIRALWPVVQQVFGAIAGVIGSFIGGLAGGALAQLGSVFKAIDDQIQGTDNDIAKAMFDTKYQTDEAAKAAAAAAKQASDAYTSYTKSVKDLTKELAGLKSQEDALQPTLSADKDAVKQAETALHNWTETTKSTKEAVSTWEDSIKQHTASLSVLDDALNASTASIQKMDPAIATDIKSLEDWESKVQDVTAKIDALKETIGSDEKAVSSSADAVEAAKKGLTQYESAVASAKEKVSAGETAVAQLTAALVPYQKAYDAATLAVKEQENAVADFKVTLQPLQDQLDAAKTALQLQTDRLTTAKDAVNSLSDAYKSLTDQLKGYADMQIAEEQPLLQQISTLKMQENQVQLKILEAEQAGSTAKDPNVVAMTNDLNQLKQKEQIAQLQDTTQFDPIKAQIKALQTGPQASDSAEDIIAQMTGLRSQANVIQPQLTTAQAAQTAQQQSVNTAQQGVNTAQSAFSAASAPLTEMNDKLASLKTVQQAANDALIQAKVPLDAAKQSLEQYKSTLQQANEALSQQKQKVQEAQAAHEAAVRQLAKDRAGLAPLQGDLKADTAGLSGAKGQLSTDLGSTSAIQGQLDAAKAKQTEDERRMQDLKDQASDLSSQLEALKSNPVAKPPKNEGEGGPATPQGMPDAIAAMVARGLSGTGEVGRSENTGRDSGNLMTPIQASTVAISSAMNGPIMAVTSGLDDVTKKLEGLKKPADDVGKFIGTWGDELKTVGEVLAGAVAAEKVLGLVEAFRDLRVVTLAWNAALVISGVTVDGMTLSMIAAGIAQSIWDAAIGFGSIAVGAFNIVLGIMDFLMSPITLIVVGLALAIGGIIFVIMHWGEISQWISDNILPKLGDAMSWVGTQVNKVFGPGGLFGTAFSKLGTLVSDAVNFVLNFLRTHWVLIVSILGGPLVAIALLVHDHWDDIKKFFTDAFQFIKAALQQWITDRQTDFTNFWNQVTQIWSDFVTGFKEDWNKVWTWVGDRFSEFGTRIHDLWDGVQRGVRSLWDTFSSTFKTDWDGFWSAVGKTFEGVWHGILTTAVTILNSLLTALNGAISSIRKLLDGLSHAGEGNPVTSAALAPVRALAGALLNIIPQSLGQLSVDDKNQVTYSGFVGGRGASSGGSAASGGVNVPMPTFSGGDDASSIDPTAQTILQRAMGQIGQSWRDAAGNTLCEAFSEQMTGGLPRAGSAWSQWQSNANDVAGGSLSGIRPGDALYFGPNSGNGNYGHTGIYEGNGMFISVTDAGVKEESVSMWDRSVAPLLGYIPTYDQGGVVPGPRGRAMLALVHGQEEYLGADEQRGTRQGRLGGSNGDSGVEHRLTVNNYRTEASAEDIAYEMRRAEFSNNRRFVKAR